jgi:ABC-2 type transport system permease protein
VNPARLDVEIRKLASGDVAVSAAVYLLLLPVAFWSMRVVNFEVPGGASGVNLFAFPDVWQNAAYVAGWVDYLLYVIVLQIVAHEYQWRTNRQNVIDGSSRAEYILGKVLLLASIALASTLAMSAIALGFGLATGGTAAVRVFRGAGVALLYFLQVAGYLSLALFMATALRRTGLAVLAFVGYTLLAEPLARSFLPHTARLPSSVFTSLVPNPFFGYAGMKVASAIPPTTVALSGAYTIALALGSMWVFARQDL